MKQPHPYVRLRGGRIWHRASMPGSRVTFCDTVYSDRAEQSLAPPTDGRPTCQRCRKVIEDAIEDRELDELYPRTQNMKPGDKIRVTISSGDSAGRRLEGTIKRINENARNVMVVFDEELPPPHFTEDATGKHALVLIKSSHGTWSEVTGGRDVTVEEIVP